MWFPRCWWPKSLKQQHESGNKCSVLCSILEFYKAADSSYLKNRLWSTAASSRYQNALFDCPPLSSFVELAFALFHLCTCLPPFRIKVLEQNSDSTHKFAIKDFFLMKRGWARGMHRKRQPCRLNETLHRGSWMQLGHLLDSIVLERLSQGCFKAC